MLDVGPYMKALEVAVQVLSQALFRAVPWRCSRSFWRTGRP
jgi:hypothetical protein